jgi:hypothetical protein
MVATSATQSGRQARSSIGLVVPARAPMTPITAALVEEARRVAPQLEEDEPVREWAGDAGERGLTESQR